MGLGKTLQTITLLAAEKEERACGTAAGMAQPSVSLVICPASLIYNWGHEFSIFAPSLRVLLVTGPQAVSYTHLDVYKRQ